jgi:hypothetical protein
MGFAGLGVDVGYWQFQQRQQQNATDAAAIGAAEQVLHSGCPNSSVATAAARNDAAKNGFTHGGNVTVTVANPPASGVWSGDGCAVDVAITTVKVASFFTRLFGKGSGVTESTESVAEVSANNNGCIYMLSPAANSNFNSGNIVAPGCSIYINGMANFSGSTVNAAMIGEANYSGSNNGGTFTSGAPAAMQPVLDPCPTINGCAYLTNNPPSTSPCNGTYSGGSTLTQGCYSNLNLQGRTVTLSPGLYVLTGSANFNGATIAGSGVTLYVAAGATTNTNMTNFTLSAPTTGSYAGVTYYQVPGNATTVNFNTSSSNVSGLIYAPSAQLNYNSAEGEYTVLVAAYGNFNNTSGEDYGTPPVGQTLPQKVVLAQ